MTKEPEGFEELWMVWRKHARQTDGRGKARPMYIKWLEKGANPQDMIDGAAHHVRTIADKDRPYINLLSVYINSERWKDECEYGRAYRLKMEERQRQSSPPAQEPLQRQQETNVVQIDPAKRAEMAERARVLLKVGVGA